MLMLISPAKALDLTPMPQSKRSRLGIEAASQCAFLPEASQLIAQLKTLNVQQIAQLMKLSTPLAELNYQRYQDWQLPMDEATAKPAIFMFKGDVYQGLETETLSVANLAYLQQHLAILSGLYGLLKPFDPMLPYRLEMGTTLQNSAGANLYAYWQAKLTQKVNQMLAQQNAQCLVNLASNEYFNAIQPKAIQGRIITPVFKDWKNGQYKIISFYAKKARGLMARYAALEGITEAEKLKQFNLDGYAYSAEFSKNDTWVFTRKLG